MSFPAQLLEQHPSCLQKCFYMMNLIKNKSPELWEMYAPIYENLKVEESWEFYHLLVEEYKKLLEAPSPKKKKSVAKKERKK